MIIHDLSKSLLIYLFLLYTNNLSIFTQCQPTKSPASTTPATQTGTRSPTGTTPPTHSSAITTGTTPSSVTTPANQSPGTTPTTTAGTPTPQVATPTTPGTQSSTSPTASSGTSSVSQPASTPGDQTAVTPETSPTATTPSPTPPSAPSPGTTPATQTPAKPPEKVTLPVIKITTEGSANINDEKKYDIEKSGDKILYKFKDGSKCTEFKYSQDTLWAYDQSKSAEGYPKSILFIKESRILIVLSNALYLYKFSNKKFRKVFGGENKAIELNYKKKDSTSEFSYSKNDNIGTYVAKNGFLFHTVVGKKEGCSSCCGSDDHVWESKDNLYAEKVVLDGFKTCKNTENATLHLINGDVKALKKKDSKWSEVDSPQKSTNESKTNVTDESSYGGVEHIELGSQSGTAQSKPIPDTAIDLDIKTNDKKTDYDHTESGDTQTYTAKQDKLFKCVKEDTTEIWKATDGNHCSNKVEVKRKMEGTETKFTNVEIHLINDTKLYYYKQKSDSNDWYQKSLDIPESEHPADVELIFGQDTSGSGEKKFKVHKFHKGENVFQYSYIINDGAVCKEVKLNNKQVYTRTISYSAITKVCYYPIKNHIKIYSHGQHVCEDTVEKENNPAASNS